MTVTVLDVSPEVQVNQTTDFGGDFADAIVPLAGGGYLVLWEGYSGDIYSRRYDADGVAVDGQVHVATGTNVKAAPLPGGGYVLTWTVSTGGSGLDVVAQRFDAAGAATGASFTVNTTSTGDQYISSVAALADGGIAIVWQAQSAGGYETVLRRYDSGGAAVGGEVKIAGRPEQPSSFAPTVTALANGGYVVSWRSQETLGLGLQTYDSSGVAVGAQLHYQGDTACVAALPGGGFELAWLSSGHIYVQRYDDVGDAVSAAVRVDNSPFTSQGSPSIAVAPDGSYLVAWSEGSSLIYSQRFDPAGNPLGDVSQVLASTPAYAPQVAALSDGAFVLSWTSNPNGGSTRNVFQQIIQPAASQILTSGVQLATGDGADDVFQAPPGSLNPGDQIDGRGGDDRIVETAPGILDLTGVTLTSVEHLVGSVGNDTFIFQGTPKAGVALESGGGSDTLQLTGEVDLTGLSLTGDWTIQAGPGQSTFKLGETSQVPLIHGGSGVLTVDATGVSLSEAERAQLFSHGVSEVSYSGLSFLSASTATRAYEATALRSVAGEPVHNVVGAALADGGYVMAWASSGITSNDVDIFVQRFAADGSLLGVKTVLNDTFLNPSGDQYPGSVTGLAGGGYVVTWYGGAVFAQQFDAAGAKVGGAIQVTTATSNQFQPSVAGLSDGGFVITWTSTPGPSDGEDIHLQRFDAGGAKIGAETTVNTTVAGPQYGSVTAGLSDGGFVVTWLSGTGPSGLLAQRYDSAGAKVGGETTVDTAVGGQTLPAVIPLAHGYAVTWATWDGVGTGLSAKVYDENGALVASDPFFVRSYYPTLSGVALSGGGFVLSWVSGNIAHLQRFSSDGARVGAEAEFTTDYSSPVQVTALADNGYLLTYQIDGVPQQTRFIQNDVHTLTAGADTVTGASSDTIVDLAPGNLGSGDMLTGGLGRNALLLSSAGVLNLDAAAQIQGFEEIVGSGGDDQVWGSAARLSAFTIVDGGAGVDQMKLTAPGTVTLGRVTGLEQFTGSAGDDRIVLSQGVPAGLSFSTGGGTDTLVVTGIVDLASLSLTGAWRVSAATGGNATLVMSNISQLSLAHGEDSILTVDASALTLSATQRAQLFSQGVDYIVQTDALFTPTGGLSRVGTAIVVDNTNSAAYTPVSAPLAGGGYIAVWQVDTAAASGTDVLAQVFAPGGVKVGSSFSVSASTSGQQYSPAIAALAGGGAVVTWRADDGSGLGVFAQRFDASGAKVGGEILVNTTTNGAQAFNDVAPLLNGGFVVSWTFDTSTLDEVHIQRFDAAGAPVGGETLVGSARFGIQDPVVTDLADGGFVVAWQGAYSESGITDIYARRFNSTGVAAGPEFQVNAYAYGPQIQPAVTDLADGGFIVAWTSDGGPQQPGNLGIYLQRYDASGASVGGQVLVNTHTDSFQSQPVVISFADGGYAVAWNEGRNYIQIFQADGARIGGQMAIDLADQQQEPSLVAYDDGFLAGWRWSAAYVKAFTTLDFHTLIAGADTLVGTAHDTWVQSAPGNLTALDSLTGGLGVDTLEHFGAGVVDLTAPLAFSGFERLVGSDGDDTWVVNSARLAGISYIAGGAGLDQLKLASPGSLDLSQVMLVGIEQIVGTNGADTLIAGFGSDQIYALGGNDVLKGGGHPFTAPDYLFGGSGDDTYYVNSSRTSAQDLVYEGGTNPDLMAGVGDIDTIHSQGQFFWDFYSVGEVLYIDNVINGGAYLVGGKDVLDKQIFGSAGTDLISTYGRNAIVDAGAGTDAISFSLYGLDNSYRGTNSVIMKPGSGIDYVYNFLSGTDHIDLRPFNFGISGADVLAQAVNVDNFGTANDYCYFYLTSAGGVQNFIVFMGMLSNQLQAGDFIT